MQQYADQKAEVPDAILFFRMGDFYEMFHEDAKTASRVLGLTLTSRNKDGDNPVPLAGVPYHAIEGYLARMVRAGFKVAISEQVEDPKKAKGVVKRAIVRIVTPGTLTDQALLNEREENYLAALAIDSSASRSDAVGLAAVELSTGTFFVQLLPPEAALDELVRLRPAEVLAPEMEFGRQSPLLEQYRQVSDASITHRQAHVFSPYQAEQALCRHFGTAHLEGFGFDEMDASLCAAGAVLDYLRETQRSTLEHVKSVRRRAQDEFVGIDQATMRSLEIERTIREGAREGSLLHAVDRTVNPMGARMLRRWVCYPLREAARVVARQSSVAELHEIPEVRQRVRDVLRLMGDVERITARLGVGRVTPRDLVGLGQTLGELPRLAEAMRAGRLDAEQGGPSSPLLATLTDSLSGLEDLAEFLSTSLHPDAPITVREGGIIAGGYNEELDRLRAIATGGQEWLVDYQRREAERTGIPQLKVGFNRVFGYYIEITNPHRDRIPPDYVRKQTVKNAERYITDELKQYETEVLTAEDRAKELEYDLFEQIRRRVAEWIEPLQRVAESVAQIDALAGLAHLAAERDYCRPEIVDEDVLEIVDGRHPVLEQSLGERFVPNDCRFDLRDARLLIITGPNMAGKSTYIRQVALLTLLAQTGSFVPARQMRLGLVDRIFARVGASDEIARGQSTFMVEMTETANILNNASRRSLVIFDEIGRGTSTFDGLSLAWAITEHVAGKLACRTLFATHYHELTELAEALPGVRNFNVAVREWQDQVVFLHRIVPGGTDKSYGVHVAKLAGIPRDVVERSRVVLAELERNFERNRQAAQVDGPVARAPDASQLLLFDDGSGEIVAKLRKLDLDEMTPEQAMKILRKLRDQAGGG
ncbi:MAG: DNA mismatch repair protein MutS [Phycisphaerae bacterium]|nr:DNA mismatch repair protein MutS [Phycisphaerae bacterium]